VPSKALKVLFFCAVFLFFICAAFLWLSNAELNPAGPDPNWLLFQGLCASAVHVLSTQDSPQVPAHDAFQVAGECSPTHSIHCHSHPPTGDASRCVSILFLVFTVWEIGKLCGFPHFLLRCCLVVASTFLGLMETAFVN